MVSFGDGRLLVPNQISFGTHLRGFSVGLMARATTCYSMLNNSVSSTQSLTELK